MSSSWLRLCALAVLARRADARCFPDSKRPECIQQYGGTPPEPPPLVEANSTDAGAIVLMSGGARTFLCTFNNLVDKVIKPLDPERGGADVYAFLKTTDPGPRRRLRDESLVERRGLLKEGLEYPDVDARSLRAKLATRVRRADSPPTGRGGAAAATRIFL